MPTPRYNLPTIGSSDPMPNNPFKTIWQNIDPAIGPTVCTSGTKPGSPVSYQWIHLTDTNIDQIWDPVGVAWVTINENPIGIVALNNTASSALITPINTKVMVATLTSPAALEPNRTYKVHAEGTFSYKIAASSATFTKPNPEQDSVYIHAASGTSVTVGTSPSGQNYISATGTTANVPPAYDTFIECTFAIDATFTTATGAPAQWTVGWSAMTGGSFMSNATVQTAVNTLLYIERV